jgi:FADH2 O2-dependent halogenase
LGSGFAGSLCSLLLARRGFQVLLVDRARHPRFAIGESSTPVADMVLAELACEYDLPRIAPLTQYGSWVRTRPDLMRGRKRGFSYFPHAPHETFVPNRDHSNELLVAASNDNDRCDTHWLRADVDQFFAREAVDAGVQLWEEAELVELESTSPWQLTIRHEGQQKVVHAEFMIDATGPGRALVGKLGVEDQPQRLRTNSRSVYSHFRGVPLWEQWMRERGAVTEDYPFDADAAALHQVLDGAWMWFLRFDNDVVSIGVSMDERWPRPDHTSAADEWQFWMNRFPSIGQLLSDATIVDPPGRMIATNRLQRRAERAVGIGWAALPHTVAFIDALHSTGIAHSLCGIERLVAILAQHWQQPTLAAALSKYEQTVFTELDLIDQLVHGCYLASPWFRLFSAYTMLYFAATISYETYRRSAPPGSGLHRAFLTADDANLRGRIDELYQMLEQLVRTQPNDAAQRRFEDAVREAITPWNRAELLNPSLRNMYRHTAAR